MITVFSISLTLGLGVYKIWSYKRRTRILREKAGLPQLYDVDDLPDPAYDPNYVHVLNDKEQADLHHRMSNLSYSPISWGLTSRRARKVQGKPNLVSAAWYRNAPRKSCLIIQDLLANVGEYIGVPY